MASCQISGWGGAGSRTLKLTVTEQSYDAKTNTSVVKWQLDVLNESTYYDTYVKCTVNGSVVYNKTVAWNGGFPAQAGTTSGTLTVTHGSDGKKSISFAIEGYVCTYSTKYANGTLALTSLDRTAPTVSFSVGTITKDSIAITGKANVSCNQWWYRLNGGSWVRYSTTAGTSAAYTITGLSMNTQYSIDISARKTANNVDGYSPATDVKTLGAAEITSASNITLGSACNVKWTPLDATHKFKLTFAAGSVSKTTGALSPASTSAYTYTGYTPAVADFAPAITDAAKGSMTITLTTYLSDGTTVVGTSEKVVDVTVPDTTATKPAISALTLAQGAAKSGFTNVAGGELCVQSLSNLLAKVTASAKYSAKIKSVNVTIDGKTYTVFADAATITDQQITSDILKSSGTLTVSATVTDSRGFTSAAKTATVYAAAYFRPSGTVAYTISGTSILTSVTWKIAPVLDQDSKPVNTGSVKLVRKKVSDATTANRTVKTIAASTADAATAASNYTGSGSWTAAQQALTDGNTETYEYTLTVQDKKGASYAATYVISTGITAISMLGGGKGVTFFGEAAEAGFYIVDAGNYIDHQITTQEYQQLAAALALAYDTASTYEVGDFVIYNNNVYECISPVRVGQTWKAASWSLVGGVIGVNLLPFPYFHSTRTNNGITWTVNDDGSVTAKGTATANSSFYFMGNQLTQNPPVVDGGSDSCNWEFSGCPEGGSTSTYRILGRFTKSADTPSSTSGSITADVGNGTHTVSGFRYVCLCAVIYSGYSCPAGGLTFYPVLKRIS